MKKLRNKAIATSTWLGGVCCVPMACLNIDKTIIILVKDVMPKTSEGRTVNAVIKAKICSDNEYVVSPFPWSVILRAGKPVETDCENDGNDMIENKTTNKYNALILKL